MGKANSLEWRTQDDWTQKGAPQGALLRLSRGSFRARAKSPRGLWAYPPLSSSPAGLRPNAKCLPGRGPRYGRIRLCRHRRWRRNQTPWRRRTISPFQRPRLRSMDQAPPGVAEFRRSRVFVVAQQRRRRQPQAPGSPVLPWRPRRPGRAIWRPGNRVVACGMQGVSVEKRVARAARQLDESVTFVRLEPFYDRIDRRGARIVGAEPPPWARRQTPPRPDRRRSFDPDEASTRKASAHRRRTHACGAP